MTKQIIIALLLSACVPAKKPPASPQPEPVVQREPNLAQARLRTLRACAGTETAIDAEKKFIGIGPTSGLYRENVVAFYQAKTVLEQQDVTLVELCRELPEVLRVAYVLNCVDCAKDTRAAKEAAGCGDEP